jgi:hypothetical protein
MTSESAPTPKGRSADELMAAFTAKFTSYEAVPQLAYPRYPSIAASLEASSNLKGEGLAQAASDDAYERRRRTAQALEVALEDTDSDATRLRMLVSDMSPTEIGVLAGSLLHLRDQDVLGQEPPKEDGKPGRLIVCALPESTRFYIPDDQQTDFDGQPLKVVPAWERRQAMAADQAADDFELVNRQMRFMGVMEALNDRRSQLATQYGPDAVSEADNAADFTALSQQALYELELEKRSPPV